ncbi:MAG: NAD-dependent epimerase/dehydratase family protein [Myxococcaceae bacterium]|nr:NAD-dependent epimerase/dehydratase family protein [Myxococcaceae bacterium]
MDKKQKIGVIIATSMARNESLFSLSLNSVLNQTVMPDCIVIVDDNNNRSTSAEIETRIKQNNFKILHYTRNKNTKNMSGTGAWNTGIEFLKDKIGEDGYAAFLDDDDSWDLNYIESIRQQIHENPNTEAVFAFLKRSDCQNVSEFKLTDLTIENFLIGNPGIQGSNMCFKIGNLLKINGFDEHLSSCSDRDLMIRFLEAFGNKGIFIIEKKCVNHFTGNGTVTSNFEKKKNGLDYFFKKHIKSFNLQTLQKSLSRAKKLFNYPHDKKINSLFRKQTTVLITGVCGFVGSHVARELSKCGYFVIGIDNLATGSLVNIEDFSQNDNFQFINLSINNEGELRRLFEVHPIDYVFHLAALPRIKYSFDYPNESYNANVIGTKIVGKIAADSNVKLFVFASSSSVYGECENVKMRESDVLHPMSPYAEQKAKAEELLQEIFKASNSCLLILRFFNVYGFSFQPVDQYSTLIGKWVSDIKNGNLITINGTGNQSRDFTYIDDVVTAALNCLEVYDAKKQINIINIGTGISTRINTVASFFEQIFEQKIKKIIKSLNYQEPLFTCADNSKAKELLNWAPQVPLEAGLRLYVKTIITKEQPIAIGVAMHNNRKTIRRCLDSILRQKKVNRRLKIILGNDNSSDDWQKEISDFLSDKRIDILPLNNNNIVQTRNAINEFIAQKYPGAALIGRLDADDEYADDYVLSKIEEILELHDPDVILAGNYLRQDGALLERKNLAYKQFSDQNYILFRLKQMANSIPEGELPSCNLFVKPNVLRPYPDVKSGEDHELVAHYLMNQRKYHIFFAEDILLTIYELGGSVTAKNKQSENYISCRRELYQKALEDLL